MGFDCVYVPGWHDGGSVVAEVGREHALLFVDGRPAPQGSKNAFVIGKRAVMVEASKHLPAWRNDIILAVRHMFNDTQDVTKFVEPVKLKVTFYIERPKQPKHKVYPGGKPDLDHYIRAVGDALTIGGLIADDALIVKILAQKVWCGENTRPEPGATIELWRL
jgi:Holliday junction resolvase RusA-like endonuclease